MPASTPPVLQVFAGCIHGATAGPLHRSDIHPVRSSAALAFFDYVWDPTPTPKGKHVALPRISLVAYKRYVAGITLVRRDVHIAFYRSDVLFYLSFPGRIGPFFPILCRQQV